MSNGPERDRLLFYCGWIKELCEFAQFNFDQMLKIKDSEKQPFLAFAVINTVGDISKFFKPASPLRDKPKERQEYTKERAKALREMYGIDENDPVLKRKLRDNYEHYDERLDDFTWQRKGVSKDELIRGFKGFEFKPGSPNIMQFQDQEEVNLDALKSWTDRIWKCSIHILNGAVSKALG